MKTFVHLFTVAVIICMLCLTPSAALAAGTTITVNTTDGTGATDGKCSLPEAVDAANSGVAQDSGACPGGVAPYTIIFNILPATGLQTITLTSALSINGPMTIDGTTQSGYTNAPLIYVDGSGVPNSTIQVTSGASGTVLKGLQVSGPNGFADVTVISANNITLSKSYLNTDGTQVLNITSGAALNTVSSSNDIIGGSTSTDGNLFGGPGGGISLNGGTSNLIQNNYLGVTSNGLAELTGQSATNTGIALGLSNGNTMTNNTVRGNVIAGFLDGIDLDSQVSLTTIAGNMIGVAADGTTPIGVSTGIALFGSSSNTIGGTLAADRNVIAKFTNYGISIANSGANNSNSNLIEGNYLGPDGTGLSAPSTSVFAGIDVENGTGNQIGGTAAGAGNLISGNNFGIQVGGTAVGTKIFRNLIGTDKNGTAAIHNTTGIYLNGAPADIGDAVTLGGNIISGNSVGTSNKAIDASGSGTAGTTIYGNRIGVNQTGSAGLPNDYGIYIENGGSAQIVQNWIANNTGYSVFLDATSSVVGGANLNNNNCILNNGTSGLLNSNTGATALFSGNWWGSATGPTNSGNPTGTGDRVSAHVDFSSFLTKTATICAPVIGLDHTSLGFSTQLVGSSSAIKTIVLTVSGNKFLAVTKITASAQFRLDGTGTCPVGGGSVALGTSCTIKIRYAPTVAGPASGSVSIVSDADSSPNVITLSGNGTAGTQLLQNGSFEIDANHDKKPDGWIFTGFKTTTDGRDCAVRKSGLCSLKFVGSGATIKTAYETIIKSGIAGDDLVFSLWSRASAVPHNATYKLTVYLYRNTTLLTSLNLNFTTGTHTFKPVAGSLVAPGAFTKVIFKITYKASSGTVWFDPASFTWAH